MRLTQRGFVFGIAELETVKADDVKPGKMSDAFTDVLVIPHLESQWKRGPHIRICTLHSLIRCAVTSMLRAMIAILIKYEKSMAVAAP